MISATARGRAAELYTLGRKGYMKVLFAAILIGVVRVCSGQEHAQDSLRIGLEYGGDLPGLVSERTESISDSSGSCGFALNVGRDPSGTLLAVLSKCINQTNTPVRGLTSARYRVADILKLPPIAKTEVIAFQCSSPIISHSSNKKRTINKIIGVAEFAQHEEETMRVKHAWCINPEKNILEPVTTKDVTCQKVAGGEEE